MDEVFCFIFFPVYINMKDNQIWNHANIYLTLYVDMPEFLRDTTGGFRAY